MKNPSGKQIVCPSCGAADLRWSNQPHILNFFMAFLLRDPIRCIGCGFRFYARALTDLEYEKEQARKSPGRHADNGED